MRGLSEGGETDCRPAGNRLAAEVNTALAEVNVVFHTIRSFRALRNAVFVAAEGNKWGATHANREKVQTTEKHNIRTHIKTQ